jgi:hypothetical protein
MTTGEAFGGPLWQVAEAPAGLKHSGQERVRRAIGEALEGFRAATGDYRIENRFQFLVAE